MNSMTTNDAVWWLLELELSDGVERSADHFDTWIENHPQHRAAFLRLERAWNALDRLYVLTPLRKYAPRNALHNTRPVPALAPSTMRAGTPRT